jgi:hypothetical protein
MVLPYLGNPIISPEKSHDFLGKPFLTESSLSCREIGESGFRDFH